MQKYRHGDEVVEAVQFDPEVPWPKDMHQWSDLGYAPRDVSFGFVETPAGRKPVHYLDWLIYHANGDMDLCKARDFERLYKPFEQVASYQLNLTDYGESLLSKYQQSEGTAPPTIVMEMTIDGIPYKGVLYPIQEEKAKESH